jgi:type III restriction enzyme
VHEWRKQGYPGVTPTTKRLLQYWFEEDHLVENEPFQFWFCQREAIETLIYVYEVMKIRKFSDAEEQFGDKDKNLITDTKTRSQLNAYPLYAFKMATGSGKTFVMALSIVWQYFNHKIENHDDYTSKFLLITGEKNVIYDRLKRDFEGGIIFRRLPLVPPEWEEDFELKVILKEESISVFPESVLFLTNIQQLEERRTKKDEREEYVDRVLEMPAEYDGHIYHENRIKEVVTSFPNIMILKDEAHHIYSFEKAWKKKILLELHNNLVSQYGKGINMELDFTATPKTETGALFPWIIVDFSLKEAIEMNIVKLPLKGMVTGAQEIASQKAVERYRAWIDAGIRRWREYKEKLTPLSKKPILFFQCPGNNEADEIYAYLKSAVPDLDDEKVLLIHTDNTGEVSKENLPEARKAAATIDDPENNQYEVIVSTLMLNEGWDVRNVNVIVGLRSYTSKRKVLPEQVIGRGLRKMFPEEQANVEKSINVLEVIGPEGLVDILEELESQEGVKFAEFDAGKPVDLTTIFVEQSKLDRDIHIPLLTPRLFTRELHLEGVEVNRLPSLAIPLENKVLATEYVALDILKGVEVVRRSWDLPVPQDSKSVINYYTDQILKQLKIGQAFADFYPLVKRYVSEKLFTERVDLDDPRVLYKLSSPEVQQQLTSLFIEAFKEMTFSEREPDKAGFIKLSDTKPFVWSKMVCSGNKCIFNYCPCDNNFEVEIAKFFDRAEDVVSFAKIVPKLGFFVEYRDSDGKLRLYYPDFVIKTDSGEHCIVEAKGREDIDVQYKDKRMKVWCEDATRLTNTKWSFTRIDQEDFERYEFRSMREVVATLDSNLQ